MHFVIIAGLLAGILWFVSRPFRQEWQAVRAYHRANRKPWPIPALFKNVWFQIAVLYGIAMIFVH